uniref:NAD(P)H-quinone oxidoreductase subunit 6, chloroplastic n=1 Tax=Adiantum capillus-veneris TaxID=13818 RepID=NU6C_ADICA|nr:NADH dehydrogenase subunit 6 [Adiantum capillus-veneris]Q85FH2.2 RecName: Full=NAD(P)H-quinone oxidoreductase subunit 6, chloroplastic; AltName: Full=NAD(P)H dehydrogenase subunit 6; AltName: Full=NADH-plastoquinone oxidoreductase subunit 6 [Adiantum capillus-veneris]AAP29444.2 NADH dehydrogenase subunit 6 [Adiantum capillus-veneris]
MNISELIHDFVLALVELGILLGSLGAVLLVNTVNSAFSLGLVFTCISLLYFVLNADFVAAAQLLVYVGAINVLTVFAVMITDEPAGSETTARGIGYIITAGTCTILFSILSFVIHNTKWSDLSLIPQSGISTSGTLGSNVQQLGYKLLGEFVIPFELLSILLLAALVGAINLARNEDAFIVNKKSAASAPYKNSTFF